MMFPKILYTLSENQNILICKSTDKKPIPLVSNEEWVIIETDTGKIYIWDGVDYVDKTVIKI